MTSTYLYLYKHILNDRGILFSKERKKALKLKAYIFVKLLTSNEAKDFFLKIQQFLKNHNGWKCVFMNKIIFYIHICHCVVS